MTYVLTLATLALFRIFEWPWIVAHIPDVIGDVLPIGVPWFGALGAVTISLYGVFSHNEKWEKNWNYWHVARPLVGMILGTIAYFILFGVIQATTSAEISGQQSSSSTQQPGSSHDRENEFVVFYVLAFIVGFREATFRRLVTRATDLMLGSEFKSESYGDGARPSGLLNFGKVAVGNREVQIVNVDTHSVADSHITVNDPDIPAPSISPPGGPFSIVGPIVAARIGPGDALPFAVQFEPKSAGIFQAVLTVFIGDQAVVTKLSGTA
ncbi:hypothetical protein ACIA8K_39705 [Catenuloplanes sp. NPDC051500]|uniref:hypothetical protein n=1 Tax=Catenuloplanes sp. NPDC051500 TaxID=3363959 RepID=UPI00378D4D49